MDYGTLRDHFAVLLDSYLLLKLETVGHELLLIEEFTLTSSSDAVSSL